MPEVDGLTLVRFLRANPSTRDVPLIVLSSKEEPVIKAEAFARGANDYLVKLPDQIELIARIRYHSRGYIALLERNEAYQRLAESRRQLAEEVDQAAKYVLSLLPEKLVDGPIRTDWRFVPSTQLGGDSFGYHWLDDDHFAMYLLDVSGHGVGASLLSVSAMNVLRLMTLPHVDFRDPGQVLQALDGSFEMSKHDGRYFTIWYGVYRRSHRELVYAGGGHPPAALVAGPDRDTLVLTPLPSQGQIIGLGLEIPFETTTVAVPESARLYIYSDGAFEISKVDSTMATLEEFLDFLNEHREAPDLIEQVVSHAHQLRGGTSLEDDFSLLEIKF
jgi:sigma-B regulation protein RsbU (phosphoserine phosphatase)